MELDPSSTEHSPPYSDNNGSWSWNQITDEVSSFTDSNTELCGLMEDKEVAARAVAFVVNSTRKGIVPLCADVAHLMRSKQSLERKIRILKRENAAFRSSLNGGSMPSQSMSPTPPSLSSYTEQCIKSLQEQSIAIQEHFRSSSRCSNSSSTYSYSPQLEKARVPMYRYSPKLDKPHGGTLRPSGVQYSPVSSGDSRTFAQSITTLSAFKHSHRGQAFSQQLQSHSAEHARLQENKVSSCGTDSSNRDGFIDETICDMDLATCIVGDLSSDIFNNIEKLNLSEKYNTEESIRNNSQPVSNETNSVTLRIENELHNKSDNNVMETCDKDEISDLKETGTDKIRSDKTLLERRRVSLPEITTKPNSKAIKVRPKQSKEIQCSLDKCEKVKDQSLEEQFMKSVKLNAKLEEDLNEARKEIDQLKKRLKRLESSGAIPKTFVEGTEVTVMEDKGYFTGSNRTSRTGSEHERISVFKKPSSGKRQTTTPVNYVGSLPHCRCSTCHSTFGSEEDLPQYSDMYLDEPQKYAVSSKLVVQLDDHVTTKGDVTGFIRYIGHMDNTDQSNSLFAGIELDSPVGTSDGSHLGKKYFCCKTNYGIFIPLNDVVAKLNKKGTREDSSKGKKSSKRNKDDNVIPL